MDAGHPLRIGVALAAGSAAPHEAVALARLAEQLGADLITVEPGDDRPDPWTLLSWLAGVTSRIELVGGVVPQGSPAVLARAAASLDLLAGGRVTLLLAAGDADAVAEAIDVSRGLWAAADPTPLRHDGPHHRIATQRGPAPAHTIPLWVAGAAPMLLALSGARADGWVATGDHDALRRGSAAVDAAAREAGRDPREIRRVTTVAADVLRGPVEARVERLLPLVVDDGVDTVVVAAADADTVRVVAAELAPALRDAVARERAARGIAERLPPRSLFVRSRRRLDIAYDAVPAALRDVAVEPGDGPYPNLSNTYLRGGAPGLVLLPRSTAEVVDALDFARRQPVPLSLRSGGHGISGRSTNDGGIVVDLRHLNAIEVVDESTRRVRLGPGARWGDVARALHRHGWALSSGDYGGVGVGGLATAGGIGWLVREHGLTIDHVRAVEMVLADGRVVRASDHEHPDLFWAVRGAGANFGTVTAFELEADEVGDVGFAQLVLDASDTAAFLQRWGAAVEAAPRDLTSFLIIGRPQPGQPLLAMVMATVDSDDPDTVVARLRPLAAAGPLLDSAIQIVPYPAVIDNAAPGPHQGRGEPVTRSGLVAHLDADVAAAAADLVASGATYFFQIRSAGGAVADVDPDATAYAGRSANFSVVAFGGSRRRLDAAWEPLQRHVTGLYLSFETDPRPERLHDAFPPRTLQRLRELKRRYDPDGVFRDNFAVDAAPVAHSPAQSRA